MFFWDLIHNQPAGVDAPKVQRDAPLLTGPLVTAVTMLSWAKNPVNIGLAGLGIFRNIQAWKITAAEADPVKQEYYQLQDALAYITAVATHYDQRLQSTPDDHYLRGRRGIAALMLGEFVTAAGHFARAVQLAPAHWEHREGLIVALVLANECKKALAEADALAGAAPNRYSAWLCKGAVLQKMGCAENAIDAFDHAIECDSTAEIAWINKGVALDDLGRTDDAFQAYKTGLDNCPDLEIVELYTRWLKRGQDAASKTDHRHAIECFERALEFRKRNVEAQVGRARSLDALGEHDAAVESWTKAAEQDSSTPLPWVQLTSRGIESVKLSRVEEALGYYDQALRFNRKYVPALFSKAIALKVLGRNAEAVQCFTSVTRLQGDHAMAFYNIAEILGAIGDFNGALTNCEAFLKLQPDSREGWMKKGAALAELGRMTAALQAFEKAAELKHPHAHVARILCGTLEAVTHSEPATAEKGQSA